MPDSGCETYLSELSPKDTTWDSQRSLCAKVQGLYEHTNLTRRGERLLECSRLLDFVREAKDSGEKKLRLKSAYLCRDRQCPVCQWRRCMSWHKRFFNAAPKIQEAYPRYRWLFLTLTERNIPLVELRPRIKHMNQSWQRLTQLKAFPAKGYFKSLEVTRAKDDYAHPHFHALLFVPPSYFTHGYISKDNWIALWRKCARLDYDPSIHVKAVTRRSNASDPQNGDSLNELRKAFLETAKYTVKPTDFMTGDLVRDAAWLEEFTVQMHGTRSVSVSGILRDFIKEDEPEDLINVDENAEEIDIEEEEILRFGWREYWQRYVKVDR